MPYSPQISSVPDISSPPAPKHARSIWLVCIRMYRARRQPLPVATAGSSSDIQYTMSCALLLILLAGLAVDGAMGHTGRCIHLDASHPLCLSAAATMLAAS